MTSHLTRVSHNTTVKQTASAACKIPLLVQVGNFRIPSLRQCSPLLPFSFSFALHIIVSNKFDRSSSEKLLKLSKLITKHLQITLIVPLSRNSLPCQSAKCSHFVRVRNPVSEIPALTDLFRNLYRPFLRA